MDKIERFVLDSYGTTDPDVTQIFSPSKKLKIRPYFEIDWKLLKAGIKPESVPISELPLIVQDLNKNLANATMNTLNPNHQYFIAFDQLDLGFNPDEPNYINRLIGLLLAARDLNQLAKVNGKKLFIVIFLRDDIYETLQFEDKNKITENFSSMIEWDTSRTRNTLKALMEKRFRTLLSEKGDNVLWDSVFDEIKEMPGHQAKYQHILDRTFLRPRDIIRFCNGVLTEYKNRIYQDSEGEKCFVNVDVSNARIQYSDYFKNELDDEIHKHFPQYTDLLDALRSIGTWHFEQNIFEGILSSRFGEKHNTNEVLSKLYKFSIIGFYRPGGRGYGGSEYVFRYKEPVAKFDPTSTRFRIHPGLIEHLGLKRV
jgi:hypothetical protein